MNLDKLVKYILTDPLSQPFTYQNTTVKSLVASGGKTFCNEAVWYVSNQLGLNLPAMMADDIVDWLEVNANECLAQKAQDYAKAGRVVIAGKRYVGHGHVAIICPSPTSDLYKSGSWNRYVPYVANVGKTNGIMPVSKAFPVADGEPSYYYQG